MLSWKHVAVKEVQGVRESRVKQYRRMCSSLRSDHGSTQHLCVVESESMALHARGKTSAEENPHRRHNATFSLIALTNSEIRLDPCNIEFLHCGLHSYRLSLAHRRTSVDLTSRPP